MKPLVIFHGNCSDGFCSAWLMRQVFSDAEFVSANYGEPIPVDSRGREVYILDFSFPRGEMEGIISHSAKTVCIDHHKTAEAALAGLSAPNAYIIFDMNKSGARLTWDYLKAKNLLSEVYPPWLVGYVEDRDLWKWELPDSRAINAALRSYPFDFAVWDQLCNRSLAELVIEGNAILRAQQQEVDRHVSHATEIEFEGHKVLCVNATVFMSEIGEALAKDRPFSMTWFVRGSDGAKVFSLRSRGAGGLDVSEVAKRHGGGGHKAAAGFQVPAALNFVI